MAKWEHIELRLYQTSGLASWVSSVQFFPGQKIELEDLKQFFVQWKSAKIEMDDKTGQVQIYLSGNNLRAAYFASMDYLGLHEWEAYAAISSLGVGDYVDSRTYFKRLVQH